MGQEGGHQPSQSSTAVFAEGGSSNETVPSPFGFPVSLSVNKFTKGCPVLLLIYGREIHVILKTHKKPIQPS